MLMGGSIGEFSGDAAEAVLTQPIKAGGGRYAASARVAQHIKGPLPKDRRGQSLGEVRKGIGEKI
jgi:hypothetical protein